jgi:uncharacterized membrane protein
MSAIDDAGPREGSRMHEGTEKQRDVTRLETLSDAVFAFSATLLVVSLEVPSSFDELITNLYGFIAFSLTFAALILLWSVHRAFFRRIPFVDNWIVLFNSVLLFVVLFYVYPLKFSAHSLVEFLGLVPAEAARTRLAGMEDLATLFMLYSAGFAAIFLCVALMYRHASRSCERLGLPKECKLETRFLFRHYLLFVFVAMVSIALAFLDIGVYWGFPGMIYMALGPLCYFNGVCFDKQTAQKTNNA